MSEHTASTQYIDLSNIQLHGRILDVGGGGEGIISRLCGDGVVAIDRRRDELEETADIGLKIVMDACDMAFLDGAFDHVTSFYTLMYMSEEHVKAFLKEAHRVLKPNGLLWIWDTVIPRLRQGDIFIVPLQAKLHGADVISTGYGVGWSREQTSITLRKHITSAGFAIEKNEDCENHFALCCRKI